MQYTCPQPLKGRYLTIQKVDSLDPKDYTIYVNEVELDVVVF